MGCFIGDSACSAGCVILGQTSGICDDDGKCWCSERSIDFEAFKELLPSRCDFTESFCAGTCHAIGRRDGKCVAESTCRTHCQAQGKASGICKGWSCECQSRND